MVHRTHKLFVQVQKATSNKLICLKVVKKADQKKNTPQESSESVGGLMEMQRETDAEKWNFSVIRANNKCKFSLNFTCCGFAIFSTEFYHGKHHVGKCVDGNSIGMRFDTITLF